MPNYHAYLERSDVRFNQASRGPRLRLGSSHYRLGRVWWLLWRWEATYSHDTEANDATAGGVAFGKESARGAAQTWLQKLNGATAKRAALGCEHAFDEDMRGTAKLVASMSARAALMGGTGSDLAVDGGDVANT